MRPLAMVVGALVMISSNSFARMTDAQVRAAMIQDSLSTYSGNCPCPYNTMRNGRACGGRSAYSRPGGRAPICYPRDVSNAAVERFRRQNGE